MNPVAECRSEPRVSTHFLDEVELAEITAILIRFEEASYPPTCRAGNEGSPRS